MPRKRYRRLKLPQLNLWQARLDAVQKRLAQPPSPSMAELVKDDLDEGLQRMFTGLGEILTAVQHIGAAGADADDADFGVLCRVLAPRLAPYADANHNVEREALVHVAALALDHDLGMLEELADSNDQIRHADDAVAKADADAARTDKQVVEAAQPILAAIRELDPDDLPEGAPEMLRSVIASSLGGSSEAASAERREVSERIIREASQLLERHLLATGGLPD